MPKQSINQNPLFLSPASAFSERYLGLPKPDPRAYTVRSDSTSYCMITEIISVISISNHLICVCVFTPQMANLAHRASQFTDKKFLIIHPTADGE